MAVDDEPDITLTVKAGLEATGQDWVKGRTLCPPYLKDLILEYGNSEFFCKDTLGHCHISTCNNLRSVDHIYAEEDLE